MRRLRGIVLIGVLLAAASSGCVERKMLIRSDPPGAQVWVDDRPVLVSERSGQRAPFGSMPGPGTKTQIATTPLEHPFKHYGRRRVRVGPIRDESDKVLYLATEREVEIEVPWYQKYPIDFFFEVLWPWTLVDTHEIEIRLTRRPPPSAVPLEERAKEVVKEAERFREKALQPAPEQQP